MVFRSEQVIRDGKVMTQNTCENEAMPDGVSERDDAVTLEEDYTDDEECTTERHVVHPCEVFL